MSHEYGDSVVLIKKSPDGSIRRVNAIVLSSVSQVAMTPSTPRSHALRDSKGTVLPEGEYLDVMYPREFDGQPPKSLALDLIVQKAHSVPPWVEGAWIGWQGDSTGPAPPSDLSPDQQDALPSANDLDAVAADQAAADATSGEPAAQ